MGLTLAGTAVYDHVTADQPVMCGDDLMPDDDRHWCLGGTSSTYDGLVEDRRTQVEQAPEIFLIGASLVALGMIASVVLIWFFKGPTAQDPQGS
ncbi:hypothetical protein ACWF94_09555 [Streptomyces sp. NPDC055078]